MAHPPQPASPPAQQYRGNRSAVLLKDLKKRLAEKNMDIAITPEAKEFLANEGYSPMYGARPLKRAIQHHIENPLAEEVLEGKFSEGSIIQADLTDGRLAFEELVKSKAGKS